MMIAVEQTNLRTDRRARIRRIRQVLSDQGLLRPRVRVYRQTAADCDDEENANRLAAALQELGLVFQAFGRYLSTRPDLVTPDVARPLATISCIEPPVPFSSLAGHSEWESLRESGVEVDERPIQSGLFHQRHRGRLADGQAVELKLIRRIDDDCLDLDLLPLLGEAIEPLIDSPRLFASAVEDFRDWFRFQHDCRRLRDSLETLRHDTRDADRLRVPRIHDEFTTERMLVLDRPDGRQLNEVLDAVGADGTQAAAVGIVPHELARTLCEAWLQQTFDGSLMIVDFCPENLVVLSGTEVAVMDGTFAVLPGEAKNNLRHHLVAVATEEPGAALRHLARELDLSQRTVSDTELDRLFRQAVNPGDDTGRSDRVFADLALQWRLATEHGCLPLRHLVQTMRAIDQLAECTQRLAPERDPLQEGLRDLRTIQMVRDIARFLEPESWGGQMDRVASLLMFGPKYLDDALTRATQESAGEPAARSDHSPVPMPHWLITGILGLAVLMLIQDPSTAGLGAIRSEQLSAILFLVIGALCLRQFVHSSSRS